MSTLGRALETDADNPVEGDLFLSSTGQFVLYVDAQAVRQNVRDRLRLFLGEWFLDARLGFPYFRDVFIKNPNQQSIISSLRRTIRGTAGVSQVDDLVLTLASSRKATVDFSARLDDFTEPLVFEAFILGEF